ncbi:MAG TPA: ferric reductase-like transmembrane domain-containing protein [Solirubrobacteraceae bacterium]|jgi:sulfoxide reductase heme-binding subunit YedZ|nr:ferric reductase-like transmembrane domain-containing protein [Solirubrobacteraceae bacterium]
MTTPLTPLAAAGPSVEWYLTRSTGAVALLLLTLALALGVADVQRWSSPRWPRFLLDALHRNVSLLALAFLLLHILTSILDSFAHISLLDALIPFVGSYRPLWLGLGTVAFDLMLAVILTSLLRRRVGERGWRLTHWLVYASWPIALLHSLGTGSDVKSAWLQILALGCLALVIAAILLRTLPGFTRERARERGLALGATAAFVAGLLVWLPQGPLGSEWARRSGTPASLLPHASSSASASTGVRR